MQFLKPGDRPRTQFGRAPCDVVAFLGGGGQGEVYSARLNSSLVALKWYAPESGTARQRAALEELIHKGPPNDRFLWPMDLVAFEGRPGFGYIMPLRPGGFDNLNKLMKGRAHCSFRTLTTAAYQIVESFFLLHMKGLCYCDISFGNVFLDANTGDVLICDNDNVAPNRSVVDGIKGTPRFMAPEIVRGEASPSTQTDLYSLAVLLFCLFMRGHPLEGKRESEIRCLDFPAQLKLYGNKPIFVFDPVDQSNRPDPECHAAVLKFWPLYPKFLRDLFVAAFTAGIRDPENGRVRESQWRQAIVALRDGIVYGPTGAENFYCKDHRAQSGGDLPACWHSGKAVAIPFRMEAGRMILVLNRDTKVFPHHVDSQKTWDFSAPIAEVNQHPQNPTIWGLKNLTARSWAIATAAGVTKSVDPGRSVSLEDGTEIDFGTIKATIRR